MLSETLAVSDHLTDWDKLYAAGTHQSVWPWTDVVRLTSRYGPAIDSHVRVLELGFGAGANIPYFRDSGAEYWGIESSRTVVGRLKERYPDLSGHLIPGDFTKEIYPPGKFDFVIDRASVTHNPTSAVRRTMHMVRDKLSPRGLFIGVDWFSTASTEFESGAPGEDRYTRTDFDDGYLKGTGIAHFCDEPHLRELLQGFNILHLEHNTRTQVVNRSNATYAVWSFVAQKNALPIRRSRRSGRVRTSSGHNAGYVTPCAR